MPDEAALGSAGTSDSGRHSESSGGLGSPLQTRAKFLKNWDWQSVIGINKGACERARAQHGINSETGSSCSQEWQGLQRETLTLGETLDRLRAFHKKAPFLFFNGNTFATIGRELTTTLFRDLIAVRRREASSAVAHYIAGVLDRDSMAGIVESLCETADWKVGDRVKTLRGTTRGIIRSISADGRIVWQPEGSESELIALPESLLLEKGKRG
jgi:hypothetical protein